MSISLLLEMSATGNPGRTASARAGLPFTPINYRLSGKAIKSLIDRLSDPLIVVDGRYHEMLADRYSECGVTGCCLESEGFLAAGRRARPVTEFVDPDSVASVLFTSGTTSKPKAVELHNNLISYVTGTVEFDSASSEDAALICVPPYHIAGVGSVLSNIYAGRKMVYLPNFDAPEWIRLVASERITTATVVPTMLDRIVTTLEEQLTELPALRNLACGGSKVGLPLVRRALELMPDVGFVNAYRLTETSSTIAVLTPEDHREALAAADTALARRLGSVGRPIPGIEVQIRDGEGNALTAGEVGELFVRGEQVSGQYAEIGSVLDADGWFATRDLAMLGHDGYLFISGRSDDAIIRGGENIAPAELEDVLIEHPHVREVAVVGADDPRWGQAIVAAVVPQAGVSADADELREYVRSALRGSRTPDRVVFRTELPTNATGKLLRCEIVESLRSLAAQR